LNTFNLQSSQTNSCTSKVASLWKHDAVGLLVRIGRFSRRDDLRRYRVSPQTPGALSVAIKLVAELPEQAAHRGLVVRQWQRDPMERRHPAVPAEEMHRLETANEQLPLNLRSIRLVWAVEQIADLGERRGALDLHRLAIADESIG